MATFVVSLVQLIGHFHRIVYIGCAARAVLLAAAAAVRGHYGDSSEIFEDLYYDYARQAQRYECDD